MDCIASEIVYRVLLMLPYKDIVFSRAVSVFFGFKAGLHVKTA
jgi:hypothetical protein